MSFDNLYESLDNRVENLTKEEVTLKDSSKDKKSNFKGDIFGKFEVKILVEQEALARDENGEVILDNEGNPTYVQIEGEEYNVPLYAFAFDGEDVHNYVHENSLDEDGEECWVPAMVRVIKFKPKQAFNNSSDVRVVRKSSNRIKSLK